MYHTPVLLEPTMTYLALGHGAAVVDATLGDGGHSQRMLEAIGPTGRLLGLDASPVSLERATERLGFDPRLTLVHANFSQLASVARRAGFSEVDGILFDLGVASWQLDPPAPGGLQQGKRSAPLGLSFQREEPLDMRFNPTQGESARQLLHRVTPPALEEIFETYGDLSRSRLLVRRILAARRAGQLATTTDLVAVVGTKSPTVLAPIFQALRIAVNDEFRVLEAGLEQALALLGPGGRLVAISYHSGEDRIVKRAFRTAAADQRVTILVDPPLTAPTNERRRNPRSRSAKLRAVEARSLQPLTP